MEKVTILGGTGLLGSYLTKELLQNGFLLRLQYRSENKRQLLIQFLNQKKIEPHLLENIEWVQGDIRSIEDLEKILEASSILYHCANEVSFDERDRKKLMNSNFIGTQKVVNIALEKKIRKMCYVSSVACLDAEGSSNSINEKSLWDVEKEHTSYADSKHLAELEVWRGIEEGLHAVMVNPTVILSDYDYTSSSGILFKNFDKRFLLYSNKATISMVDVQDVVERMIILMNSDIHSERYIVSGGRISMKEMCEIFRKAYGKGTLIKVESYWFRIAQFLNSIIGFAFPFLRKFSNSFFDTLQSDLYYETDKMDALFDAPYKEVSISLYQYAKEYKQNSKKNK